MKLRVKSIFVGIFILFATTAEAQLTNGQVFHFPFNGNANDIGPNGLNGTLFGSPTFVTDVNGNANSAINFNGSNQYMTIPVSSTYQNTTQPITFSFWVNPSSLSSDWKPIFNLDQLTATWNGYWCAATDSWLAIYQGDGNLAGPNSRRQASVVYSLPLNTWTHVTGIIRGPTDMEIYIDCVQQTVGYSGSGGGVSWSNSPGGVARGSNGNWLPPGYKYFDGAVDEFRFWNRELTAAEIQLLCTPCTNDTAAISQSICSSDSILFGGQWISQSGQYTASTPLPTGCDSITILDLTTFTNDTVRMDMNLCLGDSVFFNNRWRDQTGFYQDITSLPSGCDSVAYLTLTMRDTFHEVVYDTLCSNETIDFGGQTLSSSGVYHDSAVSVYGCDSISTLYLTATNYTDSVYFIIEGNSCQQGFVTLRAIGSQRYIWNSGAQSDTISTLYNGYFEVTGFSSCGVSTYGDTIRDNCLKDFGDPPSRLFVPKAFTPNGDFVNDVFLPQGNGILAYELSIYNRWGARIFYTTDINQGWDGTYQGELQPPGMYSYIVNYMVSGELFKYQRGTIYLSR